MNDTELTSHFNKLAGQAAPRFCSLRIVHERHETLGVRRDVVQPVRRREDLGAMISVVDGGGMGYAATPDLSFAGLEQALEQARGWARMGAAAGVIDAVAPLQDRTRAGAYASAVEQPWSTFSLADKLDLLRRECARLKVNDSIVNWQASLWHSAKDTLYLASDGSRIRQRFEALMPALSATAHRRGESQTRSFGGGAHMRQGGLEILQKVGFYDAAPGIGEQAAELLGAPDCPSGDLDVILAPDQMVLQIHESIGHPLELDRILGDERNYAGTSFVTPDMFGAYRYGSALLNVTFDPSLDGEIASYAFDDEGSPAEKCYLIKEGVLLRPLGGSLSQRRANLPGVANARASGWNRPPIDRMANLNLEPGEGGFGALLARVERGVYMESNRSWSIDDSRNKFQFGCEWGRLIEDGELRGVVKNPNYRGVSAAFWRSLDGVGDASTVAVLSAAYCGKGEPNQGVAVGHASPPCLFRRVAVFGGG